MFGLGKSKKGDGLTEADIRRALSRVQDPDLNRDIVSLGFVKNVAIEGDKVAFDVELTTPACPVKDQLKRECEDAVRDLGASEVAVNMTARVRQMAGGTSRPIPGVRTLLAVASGKGGVGKSTVSINLALALAKTGARTGLMDCDIYGPSLPAMIGDQPQPRALPDKRIEPVRAHGLVTMSMGFLLPPGKAATWRGPMVHKMIQQFLFGVAWGELDYLILDLPPGTGDVQLSLTQETPLSAGLIVSTPQEAALQDARKGVEMFRQVQVPILGFVENMSYYLCGKCDKRHEIFGSGGGERLAREYQLPLMAQLPLDARVSADEGAGRPLFVREPESPLGQAYVDLAGRVAAGLSTLSASAWSKPGPQAMEV